MVYSKIILGFIISKKGQLLNPKKIHVIVNMPILEINNRSKCLMAWHKFMGILLTFAFIMAHITKLMIKINTFHLDTLM
jgi:hypothetical protein